MELLRSLKDLQKYAVHANDGDIGNVADFFFDDEKWVIRYLVVDLGTWISGRKVLISTAALLQPEWGNASFPVSITRKQVEESPDIDTDKPVSRQHEINLNFHYNWGTYWGPVEPFFGVVAPPPPPIAPDIKTAEEKNGKFDPHLRSTGVVTGYHIQAVDGGIGHVHDFIIDVNSWSIHYLVIDTHNILPEKLVLISPAWVQKISWEDRNVYMDTIKEKVKNAPPYDPSNPVNRRYEEVLYDYYGRPKYWG
jgi:sporulation protein YlmC with PRC-barrel domain